MTNIDRKGVNRYGYLIAVNTSIISFQNSKAYQIALRTTKKIFVPKPRYLWLAPIPTKNVELFLPFFAIQVKPGLSESFMIVEILQHFQ